MVSEAKFEFETIFSWKLRNDISNVVLHNLEAELCGYNEMFGLQFNI